MECLSQINVQTTRRDTKYTPPGATKIMADHWQSPWHGYKLDLIATDRYIEKLCLVGLGEDGDP